MPSPTDATITVDGVTLALRIERKAVKHINARLRDGVLLVSAPPRVAQQTLDEAITDLARRLLRRQHAHQVNQEEDALALANRVAARFPQPIQVAQVLFVTNQEARWGSYSPSTRTIRLNATLRAMPRWVLEAVVAHELAHAVHPDHSPQFWALLRSVAPDTDRADAFLQGAIWLARRWDDLPPVERAILTREREC
ncbi:MAG: M48 family metallopeptidase [Roseiflexaceae bacterium]